MNTKMCFIDGQATDKKCKTKATHSEGPGSPLSNGIGGGQKQLIRLNKKNSM